jgi:hypothetical protein
MDAILNDFVKNIDTNYSTTDDDKPDPPVSLIIADNISGFLKKTSSVTHLIRRNRHYWTTMFISNLTSKDVPRVFRTLVKCVVFSHCTNDGEIMAILDDYSGIFYGGREAMFRIWNEANKIKYSYLMINKSVDNDVKIYQIGTDGFYEFEGASTSKHMAEHYGNQNLKNLKGLDLLISQTYQTLFIVLRVNKISKTNRHIFDILRLLSIKIIYIVSI